MARIARVIAPGFPHHVTQRGNRRQKTFFSQGDYKAYVELLKAHCDAHKVKIWGWCLMPNHVHLIAVPATRDGLRLAIGKTHRHYSRRVNFRKGWRGHLWQGRFASYPMDEPHMWQATRYIDLNPLRARLVSKPEDWLWCSARSRLLVEEDPLLSDGNPFDQIEDMTDFSDWREFLAQGMADEEVVEKLRKHERTGRPLGSEDFLKRLSRRLKRDLIPKRPGREPKKAKRSK